MDLANHISPALILVQVGGCDWSELGDQLAAAVAAESEASLPEMLTGARVRRAPLFIPGGGVVLHDRCANMSDIRFALACLEQPLALPADEEARADVVLYISSGPERAAWALKAAGHFRQLLKKGELRRRLATAAPVVIHRWLSSLALRLDAPVLARDIMRPPFFEVFADTPVTEVTQLMEKHRSNAIAVVDREQRIIGEITSNRLFKLGIPEFFERLASVSFIREFDPFERYYLQTGRALAGEVMTTDFTAIDEDATIMEIVFTLTVQNHRKIYVVRDGRRVGVIDRVEILNKILNF